MADENAKMDNNQEDQRDGSSAHVEGKADGVGNKAPPQNHEGDSGIKPSSEDIKSGDNTSDPPPSCKKCFSKFADRKSVVCPHEFCNDCWETMVSVPVEQKKSKNAEGSLENPAVFTCALCAATNKSVRPKSAYPVKMAETLGKDVKKLKHFKVLLKREKIFPEAMAWSKSDDCVLVDTNLKEIIITDAEGKIKKHFPYLRNHDFQGGLALDADGLIRVALKNERFSGISYYTMMGQFKFSAFLYDETPHIGDIVSLDLDENGNMVALDRAKLNLCYISKEKRVESHAILQRNQDGVQLEIKEVEENGKIPGQQNDKSTPENNKDNQPEVLVVSEAKVSSRNEEGENGQEKGENGQEKGENNQENSENQEKAENNQEKEGNNQEHAENNQETQENNKEKQENPSEDPNPAPSVPAGLTSMAVNSWGQVILCEQDSATLRIIEKHEHYVEEVDYIDLSDKITLPPGAPAVLTLSIDEHDNVLVLDRCTNRVLRYNTEGLFLDILVQFPCQVKISEGKDDDEDEEETDVYLVKDISCNMKGLLAVMYTREPCSSVQGGEDKPVDNEATSSKRTEVALYSYSTARKQRRKERKVKENKSSAKPEKGAESKSKCCVLM